MDIKAEREYYEFRHLLPDASRRRTLRWLVDEAEENLKLVEERGETRTVWELSQYNTAEIGFMAAFASTKGLRICIKFQQHNHQLYFYFEKEDKQ